MKHFYLIVLFLILCAGNLLAQNSDFYGKNLDKSICPPQFGMEDDKDAIASLNKICSAADIPNNFALMPCTGIGNCFALYKNGVSYIVYDINFFRRVQTYGFTEKNLPGNNKVDWVALTVLAHELGHHLCQHTTNTLLASRFTPIQLELQADEFAGAILFKLGATLEQAQKAMYSDGVTEEASLTHPARKDRLAAIAKGFNKYANKGANNAIINTTPTPTGGKLIIVIPQFQIIAQNVQPSMAEQLKQSLVNNMEQDGTFKIVASSFDMKNFRNDPAVAYGSDLIQRANYILLGKILQYEEKDNSFGLGQYKASLGKTIHYAFAFEMINAKTNEVVSTKTCEIKVKSGTIGLANTKYNGNMTIDADIQGAFNKKATEVIKYFADQKTKIVAN